MNNEQTIVCSKIKNDKFKIAIFNGFKHEEIYKTKEEIEDIIRYLNNTIHDEYSQWKAENETDKKIKEYNNL